MYVWIAKGKLVEQQLVVKVVVKFTSIIGMGGNTLDTIIVWAAASK